MKRVLIFTVALVCAGAAFAAVRDAAPGTSAVAGTPETGMDTWGLMVRSFAILPSSGTNSTGAVCTFDNYFITGMWTSFTAFYVYGPTGSFVRSVSATSPSGGFRDGTGRCHAGSGYFVAGGSGPGPYGLFTYTAGGNPGSSSTGTILTGGRGVAFDGTYYYATTGSWSTPIGRYTTTGSLVGTLSYGNGVPIYGIAAHPYYASYIYAYTQDSGNPCKQVLMATGSVVRSFTTGGMAGGLDAGWSNGYLYCVGQDPTRFCWVYDGELGMTNVAPKSLGAVKAVYR